MVREVMLESNFPASCLTCRYSIVLCYIPEKEEYVTWIRNDETGGFGSGRYFQALPEAQADFHSRVAAESRSHL